MSRFPDFRGFPPSYLKAIDLCIDELNPFLTRAEILVLQYILRRTFGFQQDSDTISLHQLTHGITRRDGSRLDHGTQLSKTAVVEALASLQEDGLILAEQRQSRERGHLPTRYTPRALATPLSTTVDKGSPPPLTRLVQIHPRPLSTTVDTQDVDVQEAEGQEEATVRQATTAREDHGPLASPWAQIQADLKARMTDGNYDTYIHDTRLMALEDHTVTVEAPDKPIADYLRLRMRPPIARSCGRVLGGFWEVVVLDPTMAHPAPLSRTADGP